MSPIAAQRGGLRRRLEGPLLVVAALAARVPFLGAGYGSDSDAWRVALAARFIRATGTYGSSRVPGHPVQDVLAAALIDLGPAGLNGATALFSAAAVFFFHRLARRLEVPHPVPLSLAFAFLPLVYLHSVNALDYLWAIAFVLAAVDAWFARRFVLAGVLLGLATGCRITSLAFVVPLVVAGEARDRRRILLQLGGAAVVVGALCYVPVLLAYGASYLRVTPTPYPSLAFLLKQLSVDLFGLPGALALLVVLAGEAIARLRGRAPRPVGNPQWPRLRLLALAVAVPYLVLFLRLPDDAAYLLPVVPFVLLALATVLAPRRLLALCLVVVASGFVVKLGAASRVGGAPPSRWSMPLGGGLALDLRGPIFADRARRIAEEAFADSTLARLRGLPEGSVVLVADWYPILATKSDSPQIVQYPTPERMDAWQARSTPVYYLPDVHRNVQEKTGIDLVARGARELDPLASAP